MERMGRDKGRRGRLAAAAAAAAVLLLGAGGPVHAEDGPQLAWDEPVICQKLPNGEVLRVQIDEAGKRVLVAPSHLRRDGKQLEVVARRLRPCEEGQPGMVERLEGSGYQVVQARLEAPPGHERDEQGRLYQVSFDLRRRLLFGVYDGMVSGAPAFLGDLRHGLAGEVAARYEVYAPSEQKRHRFRFLEGWLRTDPFEVEALALAYDVGKTSDEPAFWITTFVGSPRRFDVPLQLGPGLVLGRLHVRQLDGIGRLLLADLAQGHLNWQPVQDAGLEDYLAFRLGGGVGAAASDARGG